MPTELAHSLAHSHSESSSNFSMYGFCVMLWYGWQPMSNLRYDKQGGAFQIRIAFCWQLILSLSPGGLSLPRSVLRCSLIEVA